MTSAGHGPEEAWQSEERFRLIVDSIPGFVWIETGFPGAAEVAEMFDYFQAHTYLGSDSSDRIALANRIAGRPPSKLSTWTRVNFPVQVP